jgi:hypothetical protein
VIIDANWALDGGIVGTLSLYTVLLDHCDNRWLNWCRAVE